MIRFIFFLTVFFLFSAQQSKLVKTKISENITARLPSDMYLLPPDELSLRYVSYRMPIAYYTDPMEEAEFSVNISATQWTVSDLGIVKEIYESNIMNLLDDVRMVKDTIETINERKYIVFEFFGTLMPGESLFKIESPIRKYHQMQYTIKDNKLYIFSFNVPKRLSPAWETTASAIMHSIKIK